MLVLSRKEGEGIVIDRQITVRFLGVRGRKICIGVEAPREVSVLREELESYGPMAETATKGNPLSQVPR